MKNSAFMPDTRTHLNRLQCKTSDAKWLQLLSFQNRPSHDFSTLQKKWTRVIQQKWVLISKESTCWSYFDEERKCCINRVLLLFSANMNACTPVRPGPARPQYFHIHPNIPVSIQSKVWPPSMLPLLTLTSPGRTWTCISRTGRVENP